MIHNVPYRKNNIWQSYRHFLNKQQLSDFYADFSAPGKRRPWLKGVANVVECSTIKRTPIKVVMSQRSQTVPGRGDLSVAAYQTIISRIGNEIGCELNLTAMPTPRTRKAFEDGEADIIIAATRSAHSDQFGQFISFVKTRPILISTAKRDAHVTNTAELLGQESIRVAVVRGENHGATYNNLIKALDEKKRLIVETNAASVALLLSKGRVDAALLSPVDFLGALQTDRRLQGAFDNLKYEPLMDCEWSEAGVYVSNFSLASKDRTSLTKAFLSSRTRKLVRGLLNEILPTEPYLLSIRDY